MKTDDFFPEIPDNGSKYMKLNQGANKFRILSKPIVGYEYWVDVEEGRKPVRHPVNHEMNVASVEGQPKYFWAMVVYNYDMKVVQILQLTQKTIQRYIKQYSIAEEFGDPTGYDIVITRSGEGMETEYTVMANPPKELDPEIEKLYKGTIVDLNKLYASKEEPYGGDPFAETKKNAKDTEDEISDIDLENLKESDLPF